MESGTKARAMNIRTILLLSTLLCASCVAPSSCAAVPQDTEQLLPSTRSPPVNSLVGNLTDIFQRIATDLATIRTDVNDDAVRVLRGIFHEIASVFESWLRTFQSTIDSFSSNLNATYSTGQRLRRALFQLSDLVPTNLTAVLRQPLAYLRQSIGTARDYADDQMETIAIYMVNATWAFLIDYVLPLLRSFLGWLDNSHLLPNGLNNFVQSIESIYDTVQLLSSLGRFTV